MVIILTFLGAVLFFCSVMFINQKALRLVLEIITGLIFVASTALMTMNYSHHFGMQKVTTTKVQRIYSASNSSLPLAIYKPVGTNGKDNIYIYNTQEKQKTANHTQANEYTSSKIKWTNTINPRMVTTETRWQYKNDFYRFLYAWSGMNGTLVKRSNVLEYPRTYVKLTTTQADKLSKLAKSQQAKQDQANTKQQGQAYVTAKVQKAMSKHPNMTAKEIQQISSQAEQEFQSQAVKQMLNQVK